MFQSGANSEGENGLDTATLDLCFVKQPPGAGGFVATELTLQLLRKGYTVRATVRSSSASSIAHLQPLAAALPGKLEIYEADLLEKGSYDSVVQGALFHTASPSTFGVGDAAEDEANIVRPAVEGTRNVVEAAARARVKRVVLTSSVSALGFSTQPGSEVLLGSDWNSHSTVDKDPYGLSKTLAEQTAWKLAKELDLDLVAVLPSIVMGPAYAARSSFSYDIMQDILDGKGWEFLIQRPFTVDSRDVALAHIRAAELPAAKGRYAISQTKMPSLKSIADAMKAEFLDLPIEGTEWEGNQQMTLCDISRAEKELGLKLSLPINYFLDQARTQIALRAK